MRKHIYVTFAILPIVVACSPEASVDIDAERAALLAAAAAYHDAASSKDVAAVVAMYGDDALMLPPGAPSVEGIANVGNYSFGFIETPGVELSFETIRAEVSRSGDMGWTLALGDITINRADGEPGRDLVRDFHVWKKADDGSWKVVVDMWNSDPPPEARSN